MRFANRQQAGRLLAERLAEIGFADPVVVGMARGGVPVAAEVATALGAPLDVAIVRKVGAPHQPEAAIGAIAEGGVAALDQRAVELLGLGQEAIDALVAREQAELDRRLAAYRGGRVAPDVTGRTAILVDDGMATGMSAVAAARSLHRRGASEVVVAVPVCARQSRDDPPDPAIDRLVCLQAPESLLAVSLWYEDFAQVSDEEVVRLLQDGVTGTAEPAAAVELEVQADDVRLPGTLTLPSGARGVVVFAHGSGSSRHSPRNVMVAQALQQAGLGTLLFDLLTPEEAETRANVFDIPLLGRRLLAAIATVRAAPATAALPVGLFGASTGGGAALWAAAEPGSDVAAVVSRGGRPDLAAERLEHVIAPTLLLVGGRDEPVIELNRRAMARLHCLVELLVVPGATHLFEEPGALEAVAHEAATWFGKHFAATSEVVGQKERAG